MEYARSFTGFTRHKLHGNIEEQEGLLNSIDPMAAVVVNWSDIQPKMGIDSTFVGDGYPLCSDLPPQS